MIIDFPPKTLTQGNSFYLNVRRAHHSCQSWKQCLQTWRSNRLIEISDTRSPKLWMSFDQMYQDTLVNHWYSQTLEHTFALRRYWLSSLSSKVSHIDFSEQLGRGWFTTTETLIQSVWNSLGNIKLGLKFMHVQTYASPVLDKILDSSEAIWLAEVI